MRQSRTPKNAKIGDTIQSSNYSSGSAGWRIKKDGSAEFNGVVLSRQLQVDSGSVTIGDFFVQSNPNDRIQVYYNSSVADGDVLSTDVPITAWAGTNKTYLVNASITATVFGFSNRIPDVYWGYIGEVLPLTRWTGNQSLRLKLNFVGRNVNRVENCVVNWKLYEVT